MLSHGIKLLFLMMLFLHGNIALFFFFVTQESGERIKSIHLTRY
jgi:hypothetical protein